MNTLTTSFMCVALSVAVTGPAWCETDQPAGLSRLELTEEAMGSSFSLVLFGPDRRGLESAAAAAFAEAHRLDRLLSNYLAGSEWSAMNREAGSRSVRVTPELFALLSDCLDYSRMSDGAFDITVGPLMKVWGFYKGEGSLPQPKEVKAALNRVGYRHVQLDPGPALSVSRAPAWTSTLAGLGRAMRSTGCSRSSNRRAFASRSCPHRAAASTAWGWLAQCSPLRGAYVRTVREKIDILNFQDGALAHRRFAASPESAAPSPVFADPRSSLFGFVSSSIISAYHRSRLRQSSCSSSSSSWSPRPRRV